MTLENTISNAPRTSFGDPTCRGQVIFLRRCTSDDFESGSASNASEVVVEVVTYMFDDALYAAVSAGNINELQAIFDGSTEKEVEKRQVVDQCFRSVLIYDFLHKRSLEDLLKFISFSVDVAIADFCSKYTPVTLLSDVFDCSVISECERVFEYVEKHMLWEPNQGFDVCRNHLLRMCNDLLRRLSRTVNTEFCGRIHVFLAKCLPLTEKSGLNLTSQFNVDNVTRYECVEEGEVKIVAAEDASSSVSEEGETSDSGVEQSRPIDYNLYCKFWQLQSFFALPTNCYDKFGWRQFQHNVNEILATFACQKVESSVNMTLDLSEQSSKRFDMLPQYPSANASDSFSVSAVESSQEPAAPPAMELSEEEALVSVPEPVLVSVPMPESKDPESCVRNEYFAKYLTSQKLIHLQLGDNNFRRSILIQMLITFQYLTSDVKFKDKKQCFLTEEQEQWISEVVDQCYTLLTKTHPDGEHFAQVVKHILEREQVWSDWKNSGCPDFTNVAEKDVLRPFKRIARRRNLNRGLDLGNAVLTALWNQCSDKLEACKASERQFVPDVKEFFHDAIEQQQQNLPVADRLVSDENFQWRAIRLLAMKSHYFFTPPAMQVTSIPTYLDGLITKTFHRGAKMTTSRDDVARLEDSNTAPEDTQKRDEIEGSKSPFPKDEGDTLATEIESQSSEEQLDPMAFSPLTVDQITKLSRLVGADWTKLAPFLGSPEHFVLRISSKPPQVACAYLIWTWCYIHSAEDNAIRLMRNALLEAELFNEEVAAILTKTDEADVGAQSVDGGAADSEEQAATPLQDENEMNSAS